MGVFDNLDGTLDQVGNTLNEIGAVLSEKGKQTADKAKELAAVASLKNQINTCNEVLKQNYREIGQKYYEGHDGFEEPEFSEQFDAVRNAKKTIEELEQKIAEIKA
ncbi:MAG: hypothetical protein PHP50_10850 [Lachnospiraceae bacterium]|nr:hypothetical protein [Lachnospiraceae bacterium]